MHRTVPMWLSPLPFLLFTLFLLLTRPSMAELPHLDGPSPVSSALPGAQAAVSPASLPTIEAPRPLPSAQPAAIPEMSLEELERLLVQAITDRRWSLLGALLALGVVWLTRKVGARWWPWLGTDRGGVLLSVLGGTCTLLVAALAGGQPFTLGLLLSCLMTAASAAGLWSWGTNARKPAASGA